MMAGRGIEGRHKSVPVFGIERENTAVGQPLFSFAQSRFEDEFADRFARAGRRCLQNLFCRFGQAQIELFCAVGAIA